MGENNSLDKWRELDSKACSRCSLLLTLSISNFQAKSMSRNLPS